MNSERGDRVWAFTPELMDDQEIFTQYLRLSQLAEENFIKATKRENDIMTLLEGMVNQSDWREIRAYLTMLEVYRDRFKADQKTVILQYLFSLLVDDNGTVRRLSAHTTGYILSSCMEENPEIFSDVLHHILFQTGKNTEYKRRRIGYSLKTILSTMFEQLEEEERKETLRIYGSYFKSSKWGRLSCLNLIEGIMEIPWNSWSSMQRGYIFDFLRYFLKTSDDELREAALWLLDSWISRGWYCPPDVKNYLKHLSVPEDARICEHYLLARIHYIAESAKMPSSATWQEEAVKDLHVDSEALFHENLQSDHYWVYKVINLDILKERFAGGEENDLYQYATHLLNTLRMNNQQEVFWRAGEDLVDIFPRILPHQKYEIIQEIFKAIELRDDSSNYIPSFLGRTFPLLEPEKQKEFHGHIRLLADSRNNDTVKIIAETICVIMTSAGSREEEDPERRQFVRSQRKHFLGILCRCMAGYKPDISVETFYLVGNVLCPAFPDMNWERRSFLYFARKVLIYMRDIVACHSKIYMLPVIVGITRCLEKIRKTRREKTNSFGMEDSVKAGDASKPAGGRKKSGAIAVYSDSFDPFSLGHRAVVQEAVDSGFHVFLNVHNFFWAMNTQPLMIRRQIAAITIADIRGAYLLPVDIPINTNQPDDLRRLSELFPGQEVYIITGSDTAGVSDAYLKDPEPYSIHHFPHIIYSKNELYGYPDMRKIRNKIFGRIEYMKLPAYYESMTSEGVRKGLEEGRDMTGMADPQVLHLIHDWNLYSETTTYKQVVDMDPVEDRIIKEGNKLRFVISNGATGEEYAPIRCRILRNNTDGYIGPEEEKGEANDLLIEELPQGKYQEFLLQEMLAICQEEGYRKVYCRSSHVEPDVLIRAGFLEKQGRYELDMSEPLAMFFDVSSFIKAPFAKEPLVREAIESGRNRLKESLADLYPGNLVMHITARILHYKINRLIHKRNDIVDRESGAMEKGGLEESFGNKICVPFGKILKGIRIPNTVTKVLNAEKVYDEELRSFDFRELPDYPSLPTQIRTIRSFGMPVILVDDVYHKGFRMEKMSQLLSAESMEVNDLIVGVMSGRGKEIAKKRGIEVESVYYIPKMRAWLQESDMYPFIGGDGILSPRSYLEERNASPSINTLLPYQMPSFLKESTDEALLNLSKVCMENAREIFKALEKVYWDRHHRTLTFERIKEVFNEPRYPEGIDLSDHTMRKPVSEILTDEIHRLARLYR